MTQHDSQARIAHTLSSASKRISKKNCFATYDARAVRGAPRFPLVYLLARFGGSEGDY